MKLAPNLTRWCMAGLALALVIALVFAFAQAHDARQMSDEAAKATAELVQTKVELAGLHSVWATTTEDLVGDLEAAGDSIAQLGREIEDLGAELVAVTEVAASAEGAVEADATLTASSDGPPYILLDSTVVARAFYQDGPLSGELRYGFAAQRFSHDWRFDAKGRVVHVLMPDGRLLVGVETSDPRVHWQIPEALIDLPEPKDPGFPWLCAGAASAGGAGVVAYPSWWTLAAWIGSTTLSCGLLR